MKGNEFFFWAYSIIAMITTVIGISLFCDSCLRIDPAITILGVFVLGAGMVFWVIVSVLAAEMEMNEEK